MKRDFELIRSILQQVEEAPAGAPVMQLTAESAEILVEHLEIMFEEGLLAGHVISASECVFFVERLTWKGHDFLANAKNDTAWQKVMNQVKDKGLALTLSVISGLLSKEALKAAGLP